MILVGQANVSIGTIILDSGTINPVYKPEWEKVSSSLQIDTNNIENSTIKIELRATANEDNTSLGINSDVDINYSSDVSSHLTADKIWVYIDGELDGDTNGNGKLDTEDVNENGILDEGEDLNGNDEIDMIETPSIQKQVTPLNPATAASVTHTLTLSNFEEAVRKVDPDGGSLLFKEWSGNIKLKILGRGQDESTYDANVLVDEYGNQNMMEIDTSGTWIDVTFQDGEIVQNTNGKMFADFIKPEFTYQWANTTIGSGAEGDETVRVVFDVTDKYFASTQLATDSYANLITINVAGTNLVGDINGNGTIDAGENIGTTLAKKTIATDSTTNGITYKTNGDICYDIDEDGTQDKIGERYELVVTGLDKEDGWTHSGIMTLTFPGGKTDGIILDNSGNKNDPTTITIGVNEEDGNPGKDDPDAEGEIVDVVDPIWTVQNLAMNTATVDGKPVTTATMELIAADKYFNRVTVEADEATGRTAVEVLKDEIQVLIAGVDISDEAQDLTKTLEYVGYVKKQADGTFIEATETEATGVKYTFSISNLEETDETFFGERAKYNEYLRKLANGENPTEDGRTYREYSGPAQIVVPANTIVDNSGNTNQALTIDLSHIDTLKPEVIKVSSQQIKNATNVENSEYEIVFDIVDKYLASSAITTTDTSKIHVLVDGEEAPSITKPATTAEQDANKDKVFKEITNVQTFEATVGGTTRTVGYRYTLRLSGIENPRTAINFDKEYTDWSGLISIKIDADTAKDTSNTGNIETTLKGIENDKTSQGDFVDFIKPDITYQYTESSQATPGDINYQGKTFTMVFDITDKHFANSTLKIEDLTILIDGELDGDIDSDGKLDSVNEDTNGNGVLDTGEDLDGDGVLDVVEVPVVNKTLTAAEDPRTNTVNGSTKTIGTRYTLVLSNLEQLQIKDGDQYLDYSGVITVAIPAGQVNAGGTLIKGAIDTEGNLNDGITITSGIDIPGGDIDDSEIVDVVDPLWEKVSSSAYAEGQTATITIRGTDKYYASSDLTGKIKVWAHMGETPGTDITDITDNVTITPTTATPVYKAGTENTTQEKVGDEYTITITGYDKNVNQIKIEILEKAMLDTSGNGNKSQKFIAYNVLRLTKDEFVLNEGEVDFAATLEKPFLGETSIQRQNVEQVVFVNNISGSEGTEKVWDVSATGDNSIKAWTTQTSAPYTVYIGSNDEIFANRNSRALFSSIGYSTSCTNAETIKYLNLLNTSSVIYMEYMFFGFGARSMTSFNLGSFDTKNVENMQGMFFGCGVNKLTNLNLGSKFDTSNVKIMNMMFMQTGQKSTSMTMNLGEKFNTTNVEKMASMFNLCGNIGLTNIYFGTTEGIEEGSITFPDNFNTSKVENMNNMFNGFGAGKIKELNLGSNFYTNNVTTMSNMFSGCGATQLATLNLGPNFDTSDVTDMEGMFNGLGQNSTTMTSLDLGDKFYTTSATNMSNMFNSCGATAMKILDLGPVFTQIPGTYTGFATNTGKESQCVIYAPESIYSDRTAFKLNSTSEPPITISLDVIDDTTDPDTYRGTINPIYKPKWEKVSSSLNTTNKQINIVLKGTAVYTDDTLDNGKVKINYSSNVTSALTAGDIWVYIDGVLDGDTNKNGELDTGETPSITKSLPAASPATGAQVTQTLTLSGLEQAVRQDGLPFKEWSGNISIRIGGRGEATDTYTANKLVDIYGNQSMMQTDETGTWINVIFKDGEIVQNTNGTMFTDFIKPEFTYKSSETTIGNKNNGNTKKVTVLFDVVDKYFNSSTISSDDITVSISNYTDAEVQNAINKQLNKTADIIIDETTGTTTYKTGEYTLGTNERKIGERYELVVSQLQQNPNDAFRFSGPMSITIPGGELNEDGSLKVGAKDNSGNLNPGTTITIGIDDVDGNSQTNFDTENGTIVDVVDPIWEKVSSEIETGQTVIRAVDKYFKECTIHEDKILVYVNGNLDGDTNGDGVIGEGESSNITKRLGAPIYKKLDVSGNYITTENIEEAVAVEYTLQLSDIALELGGYIEFTPANVEELVGDTAKYKAEAGGAVEIKILPGTIEDDSGNQNILTEFEIGTMDSTSPEIYDIGKTQNSSENTQTFIFNVTDRNYNPTDFITTEEITVWVDNVKVEGLIADANALTHKEIKAEIDGTTKVLGHQYTLVLSNIVETIEKYRDSGREFQELSGTIEIRIAQNAAKDNKENTLNPNTTKINDFVDYIKPEITYVYSESSQGNPGDIDYEGKTFKMVFKVIDKYFANSTLETELAAATTTAQKQAVIDKYLTIEIDNEEPDWTKVNKDLTVANVTAETAFNKTVSGAIVNDNHIIGREYTLVLSNLEQLQIKDGDEYLDYSGVITVALNGQIETTPTGIATDTEGNFNDGISITSGIDIPGGAVGDSEIVDVVDPLWEMVREDSSAYAVGQTATIKIRGTDKYYASSNLTGKIKVYANGTTDITSSVDIQGLTTATPVYKTGTDDQQVGDEYILTITGFAQDVNQIKIEILEDAMLDTSGNGNKTTQFIVYNVLKLTSSEAEATSAFLGESTATTLYPANSTLEPIYRQDIEKVIFVDDLDDLIDGTLPRIWDVSAKTWTYKEGVQRVWDVSARGDDSILAWTLQTRAPYTVYIGSPYEIFGNQISKYLFSYLGYADTPGAEDETVTVIDNMNLLNTSSVIDMSYMFKNCGYAAMTSLNLGELDTKNVTNMTEMFNSCGYMLMDTFSLGSQFNTANVENMTKMFQNCGYQKMTNLNLGNQFDTSKVEVMSYMFSFCGVENMQTLILGDKFNTLAVTDMSYMFSVCGNKKLGVLDLRPSESATEEQKANMFNTSNVTNMSYMFNRCGYGETLADGTVTGMTNLYLGDNFYTNNVENMSYMFSNVGLNKLETLDLGDNFDTSNVTNMERMFFQAGFSNMTSLDLGTKFNTVEVENMYGMFEGCGYSKLTSLDLGNLFYTTSATDMSKMFYQCGMTKMTILDLGPAFTKIDDVYGDMFYNTGKSGTCTIYAPESIYRNKNAFKLSSTDETTTPIALEYTKGTINPKYRTEWVKETTDVTVDGTNIANSKIEITLRGQLISTTPKEEYITDVTSTLPTGTLTETNKDLIKVFIDETEITDIVQVSVEAPTEETVTKIPAIEAAEGVEAKPAVKAKEILQKITITNFGETTRRTGIPFKEWSGNIRLQLADRTLIDKYGSYIGTITETDAEGNTVETTGPITNVFTDASGNYIGNGNMDSLDNESGEWIDIQVKDETESTQNTDTKMFTDFIKPEFTYKASETVIGNGNNGDTKQVAVLFEVTDKYFKETTMAADDISIQLIDTDPATTIDPAHITKTLTKTHDIIMASDGTVSYKEYTQGTEYELQEGESRIGEKYHLLVEGLEQRDANGFSNGYTYSGPMSIVFDAGKVSDNSDNSNDATTITIGVDETDGDATDEGEAGSSQIVDVVDPIIFYSYSSIDRFGDTVSVTLRAEDKYLTSEKLVELQNNVIVKVVKPNGEIVKDRIVTKAEDGTITSSEDNPDSTITKVISRTTKQDQYMIFQVILSDFGEDEGVTSLIIPQDVIFDTSGNGNKETEILIGYPNDGTAFKDSIVDFTDPIWSYSISSIQRDRAEQTGTVTLEVKGTDIYFDDKYFNDEAYQLNLSNVIVKINGETNSAVTKTFAQNGEGEIKKEYVTETAENGDILKGVKYTIILGNFGTNEGKVNIVIPQDAIRDTSTNKNQETPIDVGNPVWVENDVDTDEDTEGVQADNVANPKYDAFRESIVDYIKPVITYQYEEDVNPLLNTEDEQVQISFNVTDTNFLESNIGLNDLKIYIDNMQVYGTGVNETIDIGAGLTNTAITDGSGNGLKYTLTLSTLELNRLLAKNELAEGSPAEKEVFERHSGVIKIVIAANQVEDSSGNKNNETTIIIDNNDGNDEANVVIVDFVNPIIYYHSKYINWDERYALITLRATDRFIEPNTKLETSEITIYKENSDGDYIQTNEFNGKISISDPKEVRQYGNLVGYDYTIRLSDFDEEFNIKLSIAQGAIEDTSENVNDAYNDIDDNDSFTDDDAILVTLDNKKPRWEYISTDTSLFESDGKISFNVKGVDKFLDIEDSGLDLDNPELKVLKDGEDITSLIDITVTYDADNSSSTERSKAYSIVIEGLTDDNLGKSAVGTYSLVFEDKRADGETPVLIDEFGNEGAAKTITFSKSAISSNTDNYTMVTYHVTPDYESIHSSYVHELMSVGTSGTNYENTTYRPSSLGELNNDGENSLFAEPMYKPVVNGYDVTYQYRPMSFAGWAVADAKGNAIDGGTVYGLYDEIPDTVIHLKAIWQDATVIFVSDTDGDNSYDGKLPTTPVKDIQTANSKLSSSGTAQNNIIVIMDDITWDNTTLTNNVTITSLYAGVDYRKENGASLRISSNITTNGDIIFDNIELYSDSATTMLIANYNDVTLGRRITTPTDNYTIGVVIGGCYESNPSTNDVGTNTIRVESGKYNNIIAGSDTTTSTVSATHQVVIGNMRDAAISKNDKLTITGYLAIGQDEQKCYPSGSTSDTTAGSKTYANVTLYSGTFTGANKYGSSSEEAVIYLRSINGKTDGQMIFKMYGGQVTGNIYGGSATTTYTGNNYNTMDLYGGQITGNIFGQGANATFAGGTTISLEGIINITGNVFGGSNVTTTLSSIGVGNSKITLNTSSATINGNIYGGSKAISGYVEGTTNITINVGTVSNIYGSGYNCDNLGATNITINGGTVKQNVFGGAYQAQARTTSNITVLDGTIQGNIYGGNDNTESQLNSDTILQDINIIIGDTEKAPIIKKSDGTNGTIYGSGKYDKVNEVTIQLIQCENIVTVYGCSDANAQTTTANIYLKGMTVNEIYGGGQSAGTVTTSNIYLQSGTATDVYGGGYSANVTTSNIILEGTRTEVEGEIVETKATVTSIYGGSNTSGTVNESNVILTLGTVANVFGGGNYASVGTSNVKLNGITIDTIHGGSKNAGVTTTTNVILASGTVTNVFGGGLDVGAVTTNVTHSQGANVQKIYGGNNSLTGTGGETGTTNINIVNSEVFDVFGGNFQNGVTKHANITIQGTSKVTRKLYGGGYKSLIGSYAEPGSATINISGGTIDTNINGGSEQSTVYGTTNINIGKDASEAATGNSSLIAGNIVINGTIYGAGDSAERGYSYTSVVGNTNIVMDNSTDSPITYSGTIYGSGNGATYSNTPDNSTIHLKDFGTESNAYKLISIERTGELYIGNSFIELTGRQDEYNYYKRTSYTLNRIINGLTIYDNTTLYTQRGFNMVGGFNSYSTFNANTKVGTKATTENVENRLYTLEGINLIFAKQEGNIYADKTQDIWGEVNGMTFFGMYAINRTTGQKEYDIYAPDYNGGAQVAFFANGTFVEGRHKSNHNIEVDGFYTNVADYTNPSNIIVTQEVIETVDYGTYYDWIIGADIVNYEVSLIGSTYGKESMAELQLDYKYAAGATYTLNRVSLNALNTDVDLINPLTIPTISTDANNTFGLTMETDKSGWLKNATSDIYTSGNGSFQGDTSYRSDNSNNPGTIIFKLYNSINITEQKDLGNVNIILTGKTTTGEDGSEGNTFIVVIAVNLQTVVEELKEQYEPSFTDRIDTELSYTKDSKVDLSYLLYKDMEATPYVNGNYRVISSTIQLPVGTKLTMKDYGQGDGLNKVYYYHVTESTPFTTETNDGETRYLYRLSNFIEMGDTDSTYLDNNSTYYHSSMDGNYVLEKYDISIDFGDASVSVDGEKVTHETYLELRNSDSSLKYDNGETEIKYNLYSNKNATLTESINNEGSSYTVVEDLTIPITLNAAILEQGEVMDTKYYDQIAGIAIQIVDQYGIRIKSPELQNFKLTNDKDTTEVYEADANGVIRMPIIEGFATLENNYTLSITQANVSPGRYTAQVHFFTSDDGKYYSTIPAVEKEFNITFVSKLLGLVGVDAQEDSRIINKTTGLNLQGNSGVDMTISIGDPTNETNIRVELYKRNPTYTDITDETTYTGTSYTLVDISQYLDGTWETPETHGLISTTDSKEYIVSPRKTYNSTVELETIDFEKALKSNITTGEYKLIFKAYNDNTLVQTVKKTFIVTP